MFFNVFPRIALLRHELEHAHTHTKRVGVACQLCRLCQLYTNYIFNHPLQRSKGIQPEKGVFAPVGFRARGRLGGRKGLGKGLMNRRPDTRWKSRGGR